MKRKSGLLWVLALVLWMPGCRSDSPPPAKRTEASAQGEDREGASRLEAVDASARGAVDRFLDALKAVDSPEGRKRLGETTWRRTMKFPEYARVATLSEEMFPTDVPGVLGYRRVVKMAIPREGGRPYVKRYLLVAYKDGKARAWKVFDLVEATDPEEEAAQACAPEALAGREGSRPQGCHVHCCYWLLLAGKLTEAEAMAKEANRLYAQEARPDDEARYYKARADRVMDMIARITGGHA